MSIRFSVGTIRATGRSARGVRGINLNNDDNIASMIVVDKT